ncbi:hypothetical protein MTO96_013129 [Rhipicephalus appendiculatus]
MTAKQNRKDYDRLRPQHRGRASSASASSRPTPWRTSPESGRPEKRSPLFQRANHPGGEQKGSAQRPAHATAQMTTKQNRDYDRLRPQHRGRPHLLRRRVARLPGEHPGVGEAREAVPLVPACQPSRRGTKRICATTRARYSADDYQAEQEGL